MKSIKQINLKIIELKTNLQIAPIVENFGIKELRELNDYIGDVYEYPYFDRMEINILTSSFFEWCATATI